MFDIDTDIDTMQHHGWTDGLILVGMLEQHGISNQEVQLEPHCSSIDTRPMESADPSADLASTC